MNIAARDQQTCIPYDMEVKWIYTQAYQACVFIDELQFTRYEVKMRIDKIGDFQYFGIGVYNGWTQVRTQGEIWRCGDGNQYMAILDEYDRPVPCPIMVDYTIKSPYFKNDYKWIINERPYQYTNSMRDNAITGKIGIFYIVQPPQPYWMGAGRFYYAKIWNGQELVADLIPVSLKNIGMVYDKIQKKLYRSCTSFDFQPGPEKL